jgi:hypothetical protein
MSNVIGSQYVKRGGGNTYRGSRDGACAMQNHMQNNSSLFFNLFRSFSILANNYNTTPHQNAPMITPVHYMPQNMSVFHHFVLFIRLFVLVSRNHFR